MLKKLVLLLYILLAFGQFAIISRNSGINLYYFDVLGAFVAFYGLVHFLLIKKTFKIPENYWFLILFSFLALLSMIFRIEGYSASVLLVGFSYFVRWMVYLILGLVVYNLLQNREIKVEVFIKLILFLVLFVCFAGFIQLLVLPDLSVLDSSLGWDPHKNRLTSTFFDPNFVGAFINVGIGIVLGLLATKKHVFGRRNLWIMLVIFLVSLVLTFSRSSWGMLAVMILIIGMLKYPKMLIISGILAFLTYFAVPRVQTRITGTTDPSDSANFRLISWKNTYSIAEDNLWFGVGFNLFREAQRDFGYIGPISTGGNSGAGSDSSILFVFATTGVFGFVVFTFGYFSQIYMVLKNGLFGFFIGAILIGLLLHSQFVNSLFYPQILSLWLILPFFSMSKD